MSIDDIKKEAKALGYSVALSKNPPPLLPCVCGGQRRTHWYSKDGRYLRCCTCYLESKPGKSNYEVNTNWNNMILEKRNESVHSSDT